jgi:glycolate oxidase
MSGNADCRQRPEAVWYFLVSARFVTLPEIRRAARARLSRDVWNFGEGGAETETTLRRNRRGLNRLAIAQNILVDVRQVDLRTSLLGVPLSWPVVVAPMGGLVLFHPQGDVELARGCGLADTVSPWTSRSWAAGSGTSSTASTRGKP